MKAIGFLLICIFSFSVFGQEGKKVQFVGGARSLISHNDFTSNEEDTVTARKTTGGYALIDLGFKINPNASTEILGMVRINNNFGGFWGSGVTFDVRQLHVKGVAGKVLRYQIGNIDYKLSPYTFYNHNPDMVVQSNASLRVKEDVLNYESFYKNNTWRQQGAAINFALQFPKVVKEITFNGFVTRLNPSNFNTILERLYGGGNMIIKQSKYFTIGANYVSIFDLKQTAATDVAFRNNVASITYDISLPKDKFKIGIEGESGISTCYRTNSIDSSALDDYFVNARTYVELFKKKLKINIGYMNNGADFRSFGAQSKRIDFNQLNNFYERYTNDQILRPLSGYDLYNDPTLYGSSIQTGVMVYDPSINNVLPYGIATFNRVGLHAGLTYQDASEIIKTELKYYNLNEIRGQGTYALRKFNFIQANVNFNLSKWTHWKKKQSLYMSVAYQDTKRKSDLEFERVDLTSMTGTIGLDIEVVENLHVLGSIYLRNSEGNEFLPVRDLNDQIINFTAYNVKGQEQNLSAGLKFNFSEEVYLAGFYEVNKNTFDGFNPYTFKQIMLYYIMKF